MYSKSRNATRPTTGHFDFNRRLISALAAFLLIIGLGAIALPTVYAATPGIKIDLLHNGSVVSNNATIPEGEDLVLRVQYDAQEGIAGKEVVVTLPSAISLNGALPSNSAIESITDNGDGTVSFKFKDPVPSDITEGAFAITLRTQNVEHATEVLITWKIGDDEGGVTIIVEDKEVPPVVVEDGYAKSVNPSNLDGYVNTTGYPDYEFTGLDPDITNREITYTLVLASSDARSNYSITDELEAGMGFVPGSFSAQLTTADGSNPFAFAPTFSGNGFTGAVTVPEQSTLRITYKARVTNVALFEAALRDKYEALNNRPGNYEIYLSNDAVFGGEHERSVNVRVRGNIPGVGIGNNFAKNGEWTLRDVIADDTGKLLRPAEMAYTFRANLTPWDGRNANFTLDRNVVISDVLIDQASWKLGSGFITVSGAGPITTLTETTDCPTAGEFAADEYIGKYCVDGNRLLINVGKDNSTDLTIQAIAQLDTVEGLVGTDDTTVIDGTHYPWRNRAQFHYTDGQPVNRDHDAGVVVLPDGYEDGVNDSAAFNKTATDAEVRVNPGERAQVPYKFTIDTSKENIDPLKARIIDDLNTDIFDISDLDSIPVSGTYAGETLNRSHFDLSVDADGKLVIELSSAGKALVETLPKDKMWIVDVTFTTIPFDGKETFEVYNYATLVTDGAEWHYWSESQSEATSYGDEAELRKRLFNKETGTWVEDLDALIEDGTFVDGNFFYRIELIPRGNYGVAFPVQIFTREDVLPSSVDFVGFVDLDASGAPDLGSASSGPIDMNGNVRASYANNTVTIEQAPGTSLDRHSGPIAVHFAVKANDATGNIVNSIIGSEATIKPYGDPSIDIEKWNVESEGVGPEYDSSGALLNDGFEGDFDETPGKKLKAGEPTEIRFTISNDGREDLVDVVVSDELTDGTGHIEDLVCVFPDESTGTEWDGPFKIGTQFECTGLLPALKAGERHSNMAKVSAVGILSETSVDDEDEWHGFVEPAAVSPDDSDLESTGGMPFGLKGIALALLLAGASAFVIRRRLTADGEDMTA